MSTTKTTLESDFTAEQHNKTVTTNVKNDADSSAYPSYEAWMQQNNDDEVLEMLGEDAQNPADLSMDADLAFLRAQVTPRFAPWRDIDIEMFLCGDLSANDAARLQNDMKDNTALRAHIEMRQSEKQKFQANLRPLVLPESVFEKSALDKNAAHNADKSAVEKVVKNPSSFWQNLVAGWRAYVGGLSGVALAGAAVFALMPSATDNHVDNHVDNHAGKNNQTDKIVARGALKAEVLVKRADAVFLYDNKSKLADGDQLRVQLDMPQSGYVTIVGESAASGRVMYYENVYVEGGTWTMPDSLQLDASWSGEDLYVVRTDREISWRETLLEGKGRSTPLSTLLPALPNNAAYTMLTLRGSAR